MAADRHAVEVLPNDPHTPTPRWVKAGLLLGGLLLLAEAVTDLPPVRAMLGPRWGGDTLIQDIAYALATVLVLGRAVVVRRERGAWLLLGTGMAFYTVGQVYWLGWVATLPDVPPVSLADALWLSLYPCLYGALFRLLRARMPASSSATWLDGLIAAACAAAFVSLPFLAAIADNPESTTLAVVVLFAYPVADIILAGVLFGGWALTGWRAEPTMMLLLAGMALFTVADAVWALHFLADTAIGPWDDLMYTMGLVAMAAAAWRTAPPVRWRRTTRLWATVAIPALLACASLALLLYGSWHFTGLPRISSALAALAVTAAVLRMVLTVRSADALADARRQARTDDLTNLPNRRLFLERLDTALARADQSGGQVAVAIVDLDRFKEVNDSFGHQVGDRLLQLVATRLSGPIRGTDVLARLGGDEFGLLLPTAGADRARDVATSILASLERPFALEGTTLHVDASIGIAIFPDDGRDQTTLLRHADSAMYGAKSSHSGFSMPVGRVDDHEARRWLSTLEELRLGLDLGQLLLHYQPQVHLATGRVTGVEALVRWDHPSRGLVYPDGFLPIAERAGLMDRVTAQVLELALRQCRVWRADGLDLSVAVNLTASNLQDLSLPERVAQALDRHGVPVHGLHLEVTENVLMQDAARAKDLLTTLRQMGIRLAVDDYGTGYSSLSYLHALPVDDLKLDRAFVGHCDTDPRSTAIVRSTVDLAHNLGMRMIAEGVENAAVLEQLRLMGCDLAQGYYVARPQSAESLTTWLREQGRVAR